MTGKFVINYPGFPGQVGTLYNLIIISSLNYK